MYTLEVPMYSAPIDYLLNLHKRSDMKVILYGSLPDSPFNGGRPNFLLDGVDGANRAPGSDPGVASTVMGSIMGFSQAKLDSAIAKFYETIEEANRQKMQYFLAATNYSVSESELTPENTEVFTRLADLGEKYGVRNAVIMVDATLEAFLRDKFGPRLMYISSCTKYYVHEKIVPWNETLAQYLADLKRYDRVVLTPQDSVSGRVMRDCCALDAEKVTAVADVLCDRTCNAHHHYAMISRHNKVPLRKMNIFSLLPMSSEYASLDCPVSAGRSRLPTLELRVPRQRDAGVRHFKIGRSFSTGMTASIDALVAALSALATRDEEDEAMTATA